ncbi:hypothetical protein CDL15_Pgr017599 [Punica granatum]|uniref:Uncharacterized protein n=1 Tax=Punica granatum TaxID=22663 RepID=A0A218W736_PUNGR|nr:hypothetical protein CDL15_Pgr017599 [Punica granatum]
MLLTAKYWLMCEVAANPMMAPSMNMTGWRESGRKVPEDSRNIGSMRTKAWIH